MPISDRVRVCCPPSPHAYRYIMEVHQNNVPTLGNIAVRSDDSIVVLSHALRTYEGKKRASAIASITLYSIKDALFFFFGLLYKHFPCDEYIERMSILLRL